MWVLVVPFGWVFLGILFDFIVNNKGSYESAWVSIFCTLILLNISLAMIHRDTYFIVGRILCALGLTLFIVRIVYHISKDATETKDKLRKLTNTNTLKI